MICRAELRRHPKRPDAVRSIGLFTCLLLVGNALAAKQDDAPDFWAEVVQPGHRRFVAAMQQGKQLMRAASKMAPTKPQRRPLLDRAIKAFSAATLASPTRPEGQYWLGKARYEAEQFEAAIAAWKRLRRMASSHDRSYDVAFSMGIAYSKMGKFARAVGEYDRAERLLASEQPPRSNARAFRATLQGNAAEALMAIGRLDEAIQRYREALQLQSSYYLAWWGLAVALDRDEQVSKATAAVQRALAYDPEMRGLKGPSVFFIPAGDVHYYLALGYAAQGKVDSATTHWQHFKKALPNSPWQPRVSQHLAELGQRRPGRRGAKRLAAPKPSAGGASGHSGERDRAHIRFQMRPVFDKLQKCYRKTLKSDGTLSGRMRVSFVVSPAGRVNSARILSSTLPAPALQSCALRVLRSSRFTPATSGNAVKMLYPLEFKPN